ncbi:MAG TPA: ABC transporter ATP-binding protein [Actinomycetes bacterium]|jgi:branched-chain amino acid transport system ATP-binding protein/urea transport system ATP-binding protein|nr:ABC transporter ATP-binding protein [Actinomycetes bacterium]
MLVLDGVHAGYGATPVLEGLSLEVREAEVVAVLGRNGVGKTTMLRAVIGTLPLRAGSIRLAGEELGRMRAHERARRGLAYVPQGRDIFPDLTVLDNLRVAAWATRGSGGSALLTEVLDEFPALAARRRVKGGTLSGGQQQLLALARALVTSPRVLLLDESSEGIQPSILDEIVTVIRGINQRRGIAVLLVEQNLDFAAQLASRAYLMDKGRIVRELQPGHLLDDKDLQREYMGI